MTTIEDLLALIPPPPAPVNANGDWAQVEATLGLRLPTDYRLLIGAYGLGMFGDIFVKSPFALQPYANMVTDNQRTLELYRDMRSSYPDQFPHPLHPEPGGLLLWAGTGNGDELFWLTSPADDPDRWPVVIHYRHSDWTDQHMRLSDGERPYEQRLQILRDTLAPTADRGTWAGDDGQRQDHFKAIGREWLLTYETAYGHQIRVAFPPDHDHAVRNAILAATTAMGVTVLNTTPPGWI